MTHYFLDSSAATKRYIVERGTGWIRHIAGATSEHTLLVAQIPSAEIISSLARQMREERITPLELRKLRLLVDYHMRLEYSVIVLSATIVQRAEDLLLKHPLRAYDAVQLASALDSAMQLLANEVSVPVLVSADRRLLAAAESEGLITDDPNQHA